MKKKLKKPCTIRSNHKLTTMLLDIPTHTDLLSDQNDNNESKCGRQFVRSQDGWYGRQRQQSHNLVCPLRIIEEEEEEALSQGMAEAAEDDVPDDGAIEIGSDEELGTLEVVFGALSFSISTDTYIVHLRVVVLLKQVVCLSVPGLVMAPPVPAWATFFFGGSTAYITATEREAGKSAAAPLTETAAGSESPCIKKHGYRLTEESHREHWPQRRELVKIDPRVQAKQRQTDPVPNGTEIMPCPLPSGKKLPLEVLVTESHIRARQSNAAWQEGQGLKTHPDSHILTEIGQA
ncbi:hypothetical protein JB92DRAFT_3202307 [Gautieria morchelliformis]|nr:hypothetical protein JB92DRAFT_3202307 [Gautieria morchelliformis]